MSLDTYGHVLVGGEIPQARLARICSSGVASVVARTAADASETSV
jgi:hypothetical protein